MTDKLKAHLRLRRLPPRYTPHVFGVIQSGLTTGMASAIATVSAVGLTAAALTKWLVAWMLGWATVLPVVILLAPRLKRWTQRLVAPEDEPRATGLAHRD